MIKRELYMRRIRPFIGTDLVKVMTGIRRCGKSVMLDLIKEELKESGISAAQFITFNFEDMRNANFCTATALHDEVVRRASEISGKRRGSFGRNFQDGARNSGKRRFRRVWKECVPRGIFHRRKDGNLADTSAERQPLYFLIPRLHPGGASDGAGALHYPQSAGRLLRRNDLRAGDPRYLFQCTSVSRYWTQFSGNLRIVSFAALI